MPIFPEYVEFFFHDEFIGACIGIILMLFCVALIIEISLWGIGTAPKRNKLPSTIASINAKFFGVVYITWLPLTACLYLIFMDDWTTSRTFPTSSPTASSWLAMGNGYIEDYYILNFDFTMWFTIWWTKWWSSSSCIAGSLPAVVFLCSWAFNVMLRLVCWTSSSIRPSVTPRRHIIGGIRRQVRGKANPPQLCLSGLVLLTLTVSAESVGVSCRATEALGNWSFDLPTKKPDVSHSDPDMDGNFGYNYSIGEPYRPPFDDLDLAPDEPPDLHREPPMVVFMNFGSFDDERVDLHRSASSTSEPSTQVNMVMFGHELQPLDRRDALLTVFSNEAIKEKVRQTWPEYQFATFHVYSVTPTPERLRGQGWITLVDFIVPGQRRLPGVITLKETHVYRRSPAFLHELRQFEAFRFRAASTVHWLINDAGLQDRCETSRHGQCSVICRGQVLLLGIQHRIQAGDHLCFLVDEAQPSPTSVITFANAHNFVQIIQTLLHGAGPRQYLTILLHGFRNAMLGTRIYGAHRQRVEDLDTFSGDIMAIWREENFEAVEVVGVQPQPLHRDSDGAIQLHFLVLFSSPARPTVLLHRPAEEGYGDFAIVEPPSTVSFAWLVAYSPWHVRFPAGHLGSRLLQLADRFEVQHGTTMENTSCFMLSKLMHTSNLQQSWGGGSFKKRKRL